MVRRKLRDGPVDIGRVYLGVGKIDSFRRSDVRAVLGPLVHLAEETKVGVFGIMHLGDVVSSGFPAIFSLCRVAAACDLLRRCTQANAPPGHLGNPH
jgi:hypothetical protein